MENNLERKDCIGHKIVITNLSDNEIIDHSIILIKGLIENVCENAMLRLRLVDGAGAFDYRYSSGKFKIILEFYSETILLEINYCNVIHTKKLNYKINNLSRTVLPIYIICDGHDGQFEAPKNMENSPKNALKRIEIGAKLLQCLLSEKIYEKFAVRKTFYLETPQIFRSQLKCEIARKMNDTDLWNYFGREIMGNTIGDKNRKYLAFLSCTKYHGQSYHSNMKMHEDLIGLTDAYVALGGGGLALFGNASLFTWPENLREIYAKFEDDTVIDKKRFLDDSRYRGTYGGCFSNTLGCVLHELCHSFDLGHTEDGVMGNGFVEISTFFLVETDRIQWTESCYTILFHHRWLNDHRKETIIKYLRDMKLIRSTGGLRAIEIRREADGAVLEFWTFSGRILKFSFRLPDEVFQHQNLMLFVADHHGNVLKETL